MAEYIKQKIQGGKKSICDSCTHRNVCKAIDNQPCTECNHYQCTADVETVVRGRWLTQILNGTRIWDCSECKTIGSPQWKRCPVCEAKMIEEVKHER